MSKVTHHAVRKMLNSLDWEGSRTCFCEKETEWTEEDEQEFVNQIIRSGVLCDIHDSSKRKAEIATFFEKAKEWCETVERFDLGLKLYGHWIQGALTSQLFKTLRESFQRSSLAELATNEQLWGTIVACSDQLRLFRQKLRQSFEIGEKMIPSDSLGLPSQDGSLLTPMSFHDGLTDGLLLTIKKLSHENGWHDQNGTIVAPRRVEVGKQRSTKCYATFYLASFWRQLERAWDRIRFFDGCLEVLKGDMLSPPQNRHVYMYSEPTEDELLLHVARQRRAKILLNVSGMLESPRSAGSRFNKLSNLLPPEGWLNEQEFTAAGLLSAFYHLDLAKSERTISGLTLPEWLRGYAVISEISSINWAENRGVKSFTEDKLVDKLAKKGLESTKGRKFISHLKIRRNSADFFDTPILQSSDGMLHLITHLLHECDLSLVVYSRIQALVPNLEEKGHLFEEHVRTEFKRLNIPCAGFQMEYQSQKLQCDAAVLWGRMLFVFECKNYNLPQSEGEVLHHFCCKQDEARFQVKRLCEAIAADPEPLKRKLGGKPEWDTVVPVVINAMPWTRQMVGDVYYTDYSSMVHFLTEGTARIVRPGDNEIQPTLIQRFCFWAGNQPTELDFMKFLEGNRILQLERNSFKQSKIANHIGGSAVLIVPDWVNRSVPIHEHLTAGGIPGEVVASMIKIAEEL